MERRFECPVCGNKALVLKEIKIKDSFIDDEKIHVLCVCPVCVEFREFIV